MPNPLPGTRLSERLNQRSTVDWKAKGGLLPDHSLIFESDFSEAKMKFAIFKGQIQFALQKRPGSPMSLAKVPFEKVTDVLFKAMK
jgi:hypothetical protein